MKIKVKNLTYEEVMALPRPKHEKPKRPNILFRTLVRIASQPALWKTRFSYSFPDKKKLPGGPYLILMNHSSFLDLKIASGILYPMAYNIVCTSDALVGKKWLMRNIGCLPTAKYVSDMTLLKDMKYALNTTKTSVLMYPEAGYSFDGCSVKLPDNLGSLCKVLKVPVLMITTYGAFAHDPLYNGLRLRKVKASAEVKLLLTKEEAESKSPEELDAILKEAFSFDNFRWQYENKVKIDEPFRATGLERVLYKCCNCESEGRMKGEGTTLSCSHCGAVFTLDEYGRLSAKEGETRFPHIPDWYNWERECVKKEIEEGTYAMTSRVRVGMMVDYKAVYMVGEGKVTHGPEGFVLEGDSGWRYEHKPLTSHGICADFFWYEMGDVIGIGTKSETYYCILDEVYKVTKARFAAEELYVKLKKRTSK